MFCVTDRLTLLAHYFSPFTSCHCYGYPNLQQGVTITGTLAADARAPARAALTAEEKAQKHHPGDASQKGAIILQRPKTTIKQPYR